MGWVFSSIFLAVACAVVPAQAAEALFDGREWEVGYQSSDGNQSVLVYVLPGETVNAWTELVTVKAGFGLQDTTSDQYLEKAERYLLSACPDVRWSVIYKLKNDAVYQWGVAGCSALEDRTEIVRFFTGKDAMHVIGYATHLPLGENKRLEWIDILSRAKLSEG